ncbi:MAG: FkbM family methyltransferase [Pseudomonadota bacterium]
MSRRAALSKLAEAAGILASPWAFLAGRALKSPGLYRLAVHLDKHNVRAMQQEMIAEGRSALRFSQALFAAKLSRAVTEDGQALIKRYLSRAEGQLLQDLVCLLALGHKRDGYFVEVGVGEGQTISNTYFLEKEMGWKGLLVEPNPPFQASITACRSAALDTRAASSREGERLEFEEVAEDGALSRLAISAEDVGNVGTINRHMVTTARLDTILSEHQAPAEIDFLSLDTEGTELDILDSVDFSRTRFGFMAIEQNHRSGDAVRLKAKLEGHGYRQILTEISDFDAWYLHRDVPGAHLLPGA